MRLKVMAASAKPQKDKPCAPPPRLAPRPTAASAARAARNATNRNLLQRPSTRQSPTRQAAATRVKSLSPGQRSDIKSDSKCDVTMSKIDLNDEFVIDSATPIEKSESNTYEVLQQDDSISHTIDAISCDNFQDENTAQEVEEEPKQDTVPAPDTRSRPVTPKRSRPQTPARCLSRPTTPAHPARTLGSSRPTTPQVPQLPANPRNSPARLATPNTTNFAKSRSFEQPLDGKDVKSVFIEKQKEFHRMKKELDLKQQSILELFDSLRNLSERMEREGMSDGGEGVQIQELVVLNVGDWTTEEMAQLCRHAVASSDTKGAEDVITAAKPIDEYTLAELDSKILKVPSCFAELCLRAFSSRQELIDWVKELIGNQGEGANECLDRIAKYNAQGIELCEALRDMKSHADNAVETITQLSRQTCRERTALITVGESLIREIARLRQEFEARPTIVHEVREVREVRPESDSSKAVEDIRRELDEERSAKQAIKDKLSTAESQLRQTRTRINKMDRQLREAEATIASLTGTVKSLEDQSRQREVQLEARARKLKESLKTGEVTNTQIVQQRNALQAEVQSLKEQIETLTMQNKSAVQKLNKELKDLRTEFEQQSEVLQKESEIRQLAEAKIAEYQDNIMELRNKVIELENSKPNPELPTEREMELWAELQATKDTLRMTEDEVTSCKREKVRFLETLTKISESDDKVGMQQKLAAELLSKEEIIGKMQIQMREMNKSIKLNEQKVMQYEQYIRDVLAQTRSSPNCQVDPNGISYQDLQQEILNLRMGLLDAVHRNEEMSEILAQKEQALEQQDKTSRAQARVIKVREELINMLKNKETEQSRELATLQQDLEHRMKIVDEVNKQIAAKADEIQELFATLENKQQQIHRLEKIVLALEEQQRRAQAQRTRHEEKIAALEHELAAGNRRERMSEQAAEQIYRLDRSPRSSASSLPATDGSENSSSFERNGGRVIIHIRKLENNVCDL